MSGWISAGSIVRLITVFLVFSAALNRSRRLQSQLMINAFVFAAAMAVYIFSRGVHGVVLGLAGAGTAALLALPLHRFGWMERTDIVTTSVIGALTGPVGFAISYGIAVGFAAAQYALKARTTRMTEPCFSSAPFHPLTTYHGTGRLSLVEMESHRMLDEDSRESVPFGGSNDGRGWSATITSAARNDILPWPAKIALATIAVLMLEIHP